MRYLAESIRQKILEIADDKLNLWKPFIHFLWRGGLGFISIRFAVRIPEWVSNVLAPLAFQADRHKPFGHWQAN